MAIWNNAQTAQTRDATLGETRKMKRDREARVQRLLAQMDEDDLAALEEQHIGNDGEQMTVAQLIQQRRGK